MKKTLQIIAWVLLALGAIISISVVISFCIDGIKIISSDEINFAVTGQFGDFIGGVVGTIISGAGFIFLYLTFKEQRESVAKERFESKYFELVRLYKDNVNELNYKKYIVPDFELYKDRECFKVIFEEFAECLHEVRLYSKSKDPDIYLLPNHKDSLRKIVDEVNHRIDLTEISLIDIAYSIVYFGLDDEGEIILRDRFKYKYRADYFYKLLKFLRYKPKHEFRSISRKWSELILLDRNDLVATVNELYLYRRHLDSPALRESTKRFIVDEDYKPYYGGHQFRLGHYFRHLFQSFKYLNSQNYLTNTEKLFYGEILRDQLSTYEQSLVFINSISSLGMKWEYAPDINNGGRLSMSQIKMKQLDSKLITKYNLIKNLPGNHYFGLSYKKYYPRVKYESKEHRI